MKDSPEFDCFTTRRIAIVDGDRPAAEMLHTFLLLMDLESSLIEPCEGAIATIRRFDPQAVILDFDLPDLRALDLAREIRDAMPEVAIVFTTDCEPHADVGAPVIRKPHDSFEEMLHLLEVVLNHEN